MDSDDAGQQAQPVRQQAMTAERLAEIERRVEQWQRGYWLAGEKAASLIQNGDERHEIAIISAEYPATIDLLTNAYADEAALLAEVERLRAELSAAMAVIERVADATATRSDPRGYAIQSSLVFPGRETSAALRKQARALLIAAATAGEADSPQEQAAQGEAAQGEACELCGGSGRYVRAIAYEDADGTVREGVSNILCHGCNGTGKRQSRRASSAVNSDGQPDKA